VIDLHCHLLPGLDDGPPDIAGSLAMARAAVASGTTTMVATPHIDHRWNVRPREIARRASIVATALESEGIALELLTGGELDLSRLADLSAAELDELRLGNGPYLLVESSLSPTAGDFDMLILRIHERGEPILLAHPERSPLFQREPERLRQLVDAGVLCSITAGSIDGRFGQAVRSFTLDILREGLAHDVASDSHDAARRPPGIAAALGRAEPDLPGLAAQVGWLTELAPAAILAGAPLPPRPQLS
jgi:protein-tyrosine phosphatase